MINQWHVVWLQDKNKRNGGKIHIDF